MNQTLSSPIQGSRAVILLGIVALLCWLAVAQLSPPAPLPADAPPMAFSAERAMTHVETIAQSPRLMGTAAAAEARETIVQALTAVGIQPEIQSATVIYEQPFPPHLTATVHNVVGRLEGQDSSQAILLVAHYDTRPFSPGASDNGVAVAALLETARALAAGERLQNDVVFLFTDGEEYRGLGAKAFVEEHPGMADVGLVLNFDARGNHGPSTLFETSSGNGALIRAFAREAERPIGNSLAFEVYQLLPNETDFDWFAGLAQGLNFAFYEGLVHYDSPLDRVSDVNEGSLQHHGDYALALARYFGDVDLNEETAVSDAVYFNLLGTFLVRYGEGWALPLSLLAVLFFLVVVGAAVRQQRLRLSRALLGAGMVLLTAVLAFVLVTLLWGLIGSQHNELPFFRAVYTGPFYMMGFLFLTVALTALFQARLRRRISLPERMAGGLLWWLILLVATSVALPGGSYLFLWPFLFGLVTLWLLIWRIPDTISIAQALTLTAVALPAIFIVVPTIYQINIALGIDLSGGTAVLITLFLVLLLPHLEIGVKLRPFGWVMAGTAVLLLVIGLATNRTTPDQPHLNQLMISLDAETGQAVWASFDAAPDEWTAQVLTQNPARESLNLPFIEFGAQFMQAPAPALDLPAPQIDVLADEATTTGRTLRLQLSSPRQAPLLIVSLENELPILVATINGEPIELRYTDEDQGPLIFFYLAPPPEGIELMLETAPTQDVNIRMTDVSFDLTNEYIEERPSHIAPAPYLIQDAILVNTQVSLP